MMDAPLWSDTGGHTGIAPTHLHHIFPHIPHKQKNHLHAIRPKETNRPYAFCLRELHVDVRPLRKIVHQGRICCHLCAGVALSFGVEKAVFIFICIFASNKNVNQEQSWNV